MNSVGNRAKADCHVDPIRLDFMYQNGHGQNAPIIRIRIRHCHRRTNDPRHPGLLYPKSHPNRVCHKDPTEGVQYVNDLISYLQRN
jgi:hypothetical protein